MDDNQNAAAGWNCSQLVYNFYWYLDEARYEDLASLFVETGSWNRLGKPLVGPAAILEAMKERKSWLTAHIVTNLQVRFTAEDAAETSQYITLYRHEGWEPSQGPAPVVLPLGILRHRDKLVRVGGIWKFQEKTSRAVMVDRTRVSHYDKT